MSKHVSKHTGKPVDQLPAQHGISMVEVPRECVPAQFPADFGQRVLLTIDTEEEFDWDAPFSRDSHGVKAVAALARFQAFAEEIGAHPVYLVDWPITNDPQAVEIIGDAVKRGRADIGVHLHPWVNPPFDEEVNASNSYAGSLPGELEAAKFDLLCERIENAFGTKPQIYRAGRYGLGPNSAQLLKSRGIAIDTSVRSLFDYSGQSGPNYEDHPLAPYWIDEERSLLELPVTSVFGGLLKNMGRRLHRAQPHAPTLFGGFSKLRLLERIALTPEGVTAKEAIRGIDIALEQHISVLVMSFHSPTLVPGFTPYTESEEQLERFYDWFRKVYAHLDARGVKSASVAQIIATTKQ